MPSSKKTRACNVSGPLSSITGNKDLPRVNIIVVVDVLFVSAINIAQLFSINSLFYNTVLFD
jgi:hypothetical protein